MIIPGTSTFKMDQGCLPEKVYNVAVHCYNLSDIMV